MTDHNGNSCFQIPMQNRANVFFESELDHTEDTTHRGSQWILPTIDNILLSEYIP